MYKLCMTLCFHQESCFGILLELSEVRCIEVPVPGLEMHVTATVVHKAHHSGISRFCRKFGHYIAPDEELYHALIRGRQVTKSS